MKTVMVTRFFNEPPARCSVLSISLKMMRACASKLPAMLAPFSSASVVWPAMWTVRPPSVITAGEKARAFCKSFFSRYSAAPACPAASEAASAMMNAFIASPSVTVDDPAPTVRGSRGAGKPHAGRAPMPDTIMYHEGNRRLQDQFDSRRISDRLEEKLTRTAFTADDKAFIESAIYFFMSTADAEGRPDCSCKGGAPGFVRVTADNEIAFPDYDGNGMFKSLGNLLVNPNVGLLFIDLHERPRRLRVNGSASVSRDDPMLRETVGAQMIVRVKARAIFPNCPRYIPKMQLTERSVYVPQPGCDPVEPAWKGFDIFKDYVHPRQPTAR